MPKMIFDIEVEINTEGFERELEEYLDDKSMQIADKIKVDAKSTAAFIDKSGRLRKSIGRRKSKFDDGGYMVKAGGRGAMQAWLIEHGHAGPNPDSERTPAHPYLKPALDRNISMAIAKFREGMK